MGTPLSTERRKAMADRAIGILEGLEEMAKQGRFTEADALHANIAMAHVYALLAQ